MDLPRRSRSARREAAAPLCARRLRIEAASYRYPDGSEALREVEPRGRAWARIVAVVGPAGAGKTTLAYLIPRFLTPSSGRVLFDGVDIAGATLASLREQIAFVFQETVLFDASVEENIRLGRPEASDTELRRAAQIAGADEFIRPPARRATPPASGAAAASSRSARSSASRSRARCCARARPDPRRADLGPRPGHRAAPRRRAARGEPRARRARDRAPALDDARPPTRSCSSTRAGCSSAAATTS